MLNNRRYVLTVDTEGQVAQWDLVEVWAYYRLHIIQQLHRTNLNHQCKKVKIFGKRPIEDIAQEVNSMETFSNWCSVDTKIGVS
jgi:WD repeat-containing protein 48